MSNLTHRDIRRGGLSAPPRQAPAPRNHDTPVGDTDYQGLQDEIRRLAATNAELIASVRPTSPQDTRLEMPIPRHDSSNPAELQTLREENTALRNRVTELEQVLEQAADMEDAWLARQKEYETLIDEKSEMIRVLHAKLAEVESGPRISKEDLPHAEELIEMKRQLDDERARMKEDEESMMQQMQQMELTMSKERAELARQRAEIQRLQTDLNREIEIATRDPGLRERLAALQRRQDSGVRKKPNLPANTSEPAAAEQPPAQAAQKSSGMLKRLFGG